MNQVIKLHKCPICAKQFTDEKYLPFCSKRCADVDLGRWFNGSYTVEAQDLDESEVAELNEALNNAEENRK